MSHSRSCARTVVLTFDNLGEAAGLERGQWPADRPLGAHPSVTTGLPRLLRELEELELRATFFVEAINCELNPEAVHSIAAHGHEIGIHGWRHESWGELPLDQERALLHRSRAAFEELGVDARSFRPPGGTGTTDTPALLREIGCRWASPLGTSPHLDTHAFGWIPFQWGLVDAYFLMESFGSLRTAHDDPERPLLPASVANRLRVALDDLTTPRTLILHPFLLAEAGWWAEARGLLRGLAQRREAGEITITTGGELTERLVAPR